MELDSGATHAEFIKSEADGEFYFLEIASRVGGAVHRRCPGSGFGE